jgi:hypothetical protein
MCNQIIETNKQKTIAYYDAQVEPTYYKFSICDLQQAKV